MFNRFLKEKRYEEVPQIPTKLFQTLRVLCEKHYDLGMWRIQSKPIIGL